jgi:hypothetical protein
MSYPSPSITASGTTFAQLQAGGVTGHLENLIAAQAATLAPTVAATATATGGGSTGGLLAAGTYYFVVTETNGIGETTAGPVSALLTVGATNIPTITFATLKTGNTARNVYVGAVGGPIGGPFYLYPGGDGVTAATLNLAVAVAVNSEGLAQPPVTNTTGLTRMKLEMLRGLRSGHYQELFTFWRATIDNFNRGEPASFSEALLKLHDVHTVLAMLATLCAEAGVLIDANPGTLKSTVTPIGTIAVRRSWP